MAPVPTISHVTGKPVPPQYLHASTTHFQDTHGRSVLLRGVNLSGGAKAPHNQPSWSQDGFWEEAEAGHGDFVGRPLNLEDGSADVHLARLRSWGMNFLRFVFTWEALEHEGPGKYDEEYMDYVIKVLYKCKEWGFRVFMDPHQDVWSRFSGGSGAPLWTLYACGIDPRNMSSTYSVLLHNEYPSREDSQPATFPQMIWATNYTHLVSQTVFTLFYAGRTYAPKCIIDGINIQDWLQNHFFDAVCTLGKKIAASPGLFEEVVIGWDSLNEPGDGMVGRKNLAVIPSDQRLKKGISPTPFEGMRLGMGEAVEVETWEFGSMGPSRGPRKRLDPKGTKLWLLPEEEATRGGGKWGWKRSDEWKLGECIWAEHGVWNTSTRSLDRPAYFYTLPTDPLYIVDFVQDFWVPHWTAYATRIREIHPEAIHFIQPPVFAIPPKFPDGYLQKRACFAPHYYDGLTLMTKHWNWFNADALGLLRNKYWSVLQAIRIGETAIRKSIQDQLGILKQDTADKVGKYPTLIGEIGCPFDMDDRRAYGYVDGGKGKGDYSLQQRAWDCSLNATDGRNCLSYTLWTYVPDNSHRWGDLWNGEDLSIWSIDNCRKEGSSVDPQKKVSSDASQSKLSVDVVTVASASERQNGDISRSGDSSSTLSKSTALVNYTPKGIETGVGITPRLLLDGARAIGAICRPFPIATIGAPERIDFDIATTVFKLSVRVRHQDHVPEGVATEIYLPYIHYAASLGPSMTAPSAYVENELRSNMSSTSLSSTKDNSTSGRVKDTLRHPAQHLEAHVHSSGDTTPSPSTSKFRSTTPIPSSAPANLTLDIDVSVSAGSFVTSGQKLSWTYPIPKHGEVIYSLEVKRKGGALARGDIVAFAQTGGWGDVCSPYTYPLVIR
ncbi:cytoplasm protein [Naematelia encephala]|uniref:Cytoplasm protein n=1 Tax=Naematelia encephala TaxID=71784 RepID=A0A1Y2B3X1_9TREE|nr:cytoplasm protein [Naematelia encephala]